MAKNAKKSDNDASKVVRISAKDPDGTPRKKVPLKTTKSEVVKEKAVKAGRKRRSSGTVGSFFGYFKGAWYELKQVRWPTRSATWGLTGAVLFFSLFFIVFILLVDALFNYLFDLFVL